MKKFALILGIMLSCSAAFAARQAEGTVKGVCQDAAGSPVGFATVYLMTTDSTVVTGAAAEADGRFTLKAATGDYILTVSLIGYKDAAREISLAAGENELPPFVLEEDTVMLEGATIQVVVPKTELTGEGLLTTVSGSVLENVGSANDVLERTPGIIKGQDGLEVIGRGSPQVYINGRKVTDAGELDRLRSSDIQNVEVITNPGAQYDATVRSVVRIKTVKRQGDGFGFTFNAEDEQSLKLLKGNDAFAALNLNYRTGGVDVFAGVNYMRNTQRQTSNLEKASFGNTLFEDKGDIVADYLGQHVYGNAGVNWQISDSHFVGGKVEWGARLQGDNMTRVHDNVYEDGVQIDDLTTVSKDRIGSKRPYNLGANVYYNGLVKGKFGIDINLDYYGTDDSSITFTDEASSMTTGAYISSESRNTGKMYAAKAVFSYPIWKGQLQVGTEETFSRRTDKYSIAGIDIPASSAKVKEDNYAGFFSYGFSLPKYGQLSAGLRYEYVRYAYEDALSPEENITRRYSNFFPTVSYSNKFGPVQFMVGYNSRTHRPNYANLSSAIRYNNRYIWQSGNAQLQPESIHDVNVTAVWKFITVMLGYTRTDNTIMLWSSPYNDEGVVLVQPRNIDTPCRRMTANINLNPTVGPWTLNCTVGIIPQWLTINAPDPREPSGIRVTRFNGKPIGFVQMFNTFKVKGGWQFELGGIMQTNGYTENIQMTSIYFDLKAAIQRTLLKDGSLVLRLEGRNLAGLARYNIYTDFGSHTIRQTNNFDTQRITLSLSYKFNTAQSKYLGTGAGAGERSRM